MVSGQASRIPRGKARDAERFIYVAGGLVQFSFSLSLSPLLCDLLGRKEDKEREASFLLLFCISLFLLVASYLSPHRMRLLLGDYGRYYG